MDYIKSILTASENNLLKLLIFGIPMSIFVKSEPVNEWNAGSIAHIFPPIDCLTK